MSRRVDAPLCRSQVNGCLAATPARGVVRRAGVVGFVLILIVFAIALANDISTLSGPGVNLR